MVITDCHRLPNNNSVTNYNRLPHPYPPLSLFSNPVLQLKFPAPNSHRAIFKSEFCGCTSSFLPFSFTPLIPPSAASHSSVTLTDCSYHPGGISTLSKCRIGIDARGSRQLQMQPVRSSPAAIAAAANTYTRKPWYGNQLPASPIRKLQYTTPARLRVTFGDRGDTDKLFSVLL